MPMALEVGVLEDRGCGPQHTTAGELRGIIALPSRQGEIFCFKGLFALFFLFGFTTVQRGRMVTEHGLEADCAWC